MPVARAVSGHYWTIAGYAGSCLWPPAHVRSVPWSLEVADGEIGRVELSGELSEHLGAETLVVILHGLGGSAHSFACRRAAAAAEARGWSSLRVTMRGADGRGHDLYHAGLAEDITRVLDSPTARSHERLLLYGASLGGHVALRHALEPHPRLAAVAAVCPPLDLAASAEAIDRGRAAPYRRMILASLKRTYRALAERRRMPYPMAQIDAVTHLREWDRLVVVPRFGFGTVERYYAAMSVGPNLDRLRVPSLYLGARDDPMIPFDSTRPFLVRAGPLLDARVRRRGGHLGFAPPIEGPVLEWLDAAGTPDRSRATGGTRTA